MFFLEKYGVVYPAFRLKVSDLTTALRSPRCAEAAACEAKGAKFRMPPYSAVRLKSVAMPGLWSSLVRHRYIFFEKNAAYLSRRFSPPALHWLRERKGSSMKLVWQPGCLLRQIEALGRGHDTGSKSRPSIKESPGVWSRDSLQILPIFDVRRDPSAGVDFSPILLPQAHAKER